MMEALLYVLYAVSLAIFGVAAWRLSYAFRHFRMKQQLTPASVTADPPSVTVCIPARNENHAMTECLERVIACTYPKLEIIVLDDVSGDDTSALIKAFAHEGVRFVEGTALPDGWLGKNHALQELLEEASGTYVLFMDVDTRISPDTIEQLVAYAEQEKALMVSVMPRREDGIRSSVLFSTLRYFWETVFHRRAAPATASNLWMIHRQTLLERWQGFSMFRNAIQPEAKFSSDLMAEGRYRFLISTPMIGVTHEKKWRSQVETSIRLLFPLLGAQRAHVIIAMLDLFIVLAPLGVLLWGFVIGFGLHQFIALGIVLLYAGIYASYLRHVWRRGWLIGALLWPVIVLQEIVLLALSALQYRRGSVTWKGRLVKVPKL